MGRYKIYKVTNNINGKSYIGYTSDIETRWKKHKWDAQNNPITHFHKALRKYGIDNFSWEIIFESDNKDLTLNIKEEEFIRKYDTYALNGNGYNYSYGGDGAGLVVDNIKKKKISETNIRNGVNFVNNGATEAARIKNTGKKQSQEHIEKRKRFKPITIENIQYNSRKDAAKALGVSVSTISNWYASQKSDNIKIPTGSNQYINRGRNKNKKIK